MGKCQFVKGGIFILEKGDQKELRKKQRLERGFLGVYYCWIIKIQIDNMIYEVEEKGEVQVVGVLYVIIFYLDFIFQFVMKLLGGFKLKNDLVGFLFYGCGREI